MEFENHAWFKKSRLKLDLCQVVTQIYLCQLVFLTGLNWFKPGKIEYLHASQWQKCISYECPEKICYECAHISHTNFATQVLVVGTCDYLARLSWVTAFLVVICFFITIPDLQHCDGGVRPSHFWTSFLTNISFQSGHSSTAFDQISILYPSPYRWMIRELRMSAKDHSYFMPFHYHARTRYLCAEGGRGKHFCRTL